MTLFLLSIPYFCWHSVFSDDCKFYRESILADDLWISSDIAFLTITCVTHDYFCYRFDASIVNSLTLSIPYVDCHSVFIDDFKVYSYSVFAADLSISGDITFLTIPWIYRHSIFAIDLMRSSWIHWRYRFHTSSVTQYSLAISRFTVTLFSLTIYGSAVT